MGKTRLHLARLALFPTRQQLLASVKLVEFMYSASLYPLGLYSQGGYRCGTHLNALAAGSPSISPGDSPPSVHKGPDMERTYLPAALSSQEDSILLVGGQEFPVHGAIISLHSPGKLVRGGGRAPGGPLPLPAT